MPTTTAFPVSRGGAEPTPGEARRDPAQAARTAVPGERDSLFATPEWFDIWAGAFGGSRYGCWRDGNHEPSVIVPFVRWVENIGGLKYAAVCSAQNFHSPSYDVVGSRGSPLDLDRMLVDLDVSVAAFHGVSAHSTLWGAASRCDAGRVHWMPMEEAPYVDCTVGWDVYWAARGKNLRANCESVHRRLAASGAAVHALHLPDEIARYRDVIYEIEASGWKGHLGTAMAQTAATRAFYDRLLSDFSRRNLLRLFVLEVAGDVVAFELCTLYAGVLTGLKCGYRESHGKLSPGQYLRYRFLQSAFGDPQVELYNMLGPQSETKRRWSTGTEQLWSVRLFRRSPRGWLARSSLLALRRLKDAARQYVKPRRADATAGR